MRASMFIDPGLRREDLGTSRQLGAPKFRQLSMDPNPSPFRCRFTARAMRSIFSALRPASILRPALKGPLCAGFTGEVPGTCLAPANGTSKTDAAVSKTTFLRNDLRSLLEPAEQRRFQLCETLVGSFLPDRTHVAGAHEIHRDLAPPG